MVLFNLLPFYSIIRTNEFIIFLVFILIISIIIIFLRKMDVLNESSTVRLNREQMSAQSMVKLKNPFVFKISDDSLNCDNYRNGVKLSIRCDNSFWVLSYWAVNIEELHYSLTEDWQPMRQSLLDQNFIQSYHLFKSEPELYYETNEEITHWVKPPNQYFTGESLGYNPRTRYPLVVVIVRNDDDDGIELNDNDVVCLISIIHLKDSICPMSSGLITQYLKQRNANIFNLQQIFTPESEYEPHSNQLCVICQTNLISHALLPCKHAVLCGQCFERIDKCPLCRASITSFFRIRENEDLDSDPCDPSPQTSGQSSTGCLAQFVLSLSFMSFLGHFNRTNFKK